MTPSGNLWTLLSKFWYILVVPKTPKLPKGVTLYRDTNGFTELWRVRLGVKFLGRGCQPSKKSFPSHAEAVGWIKEEETRIHPHSIEAKEFGLSPHLVAEVQVALKKLGGRASLVDVADYWLRHAAPVEDSPTVATAIAKLHADQEKQGLSSRHVRETKAKLKRIFRGLENRKMSEITTEDIEKARDAKDATGSNPRPAQRVKRIRYASILINWAVERRWIQPERLPLRGVSKPRLRGTRVSVLTPEDAARLLIATRDLIPELLPALAIKLFSGVRNEELYFLPWSAIKPSTIRVEKTKTDKARSVSLLGPISSWLPRQRPSGRIFDLKPLVVDREAVWLDAMKELRTAAKIQLPQNVLRHTFGSYHCGLEKDPNRTAFEIGNTPAVARRHYVDAVDNTDVAKFWLLNSDFLEPFDLNHPVVWPKTHVIKALKEIVAIDVPEAKQELQWSKTTPEPHKRKYTIEDTIHNRSIFAFLIDSGDGSPGEIVSDEDWEEGELSTARARVRLLRQMGYVI